MKARLCAARLAAIALSLSIGGVRAAAQQADEGGTENRVRLGAFRLAPVIVFTSGMDTNVFNTPDQQRSDFTWTLSPRATTTLRLGQARLTGKGSADFVYFQRNASERSVNVEGSVKLTLPMNRIQPYVASSFLKTRERPNFEVDARSLRYERSAGAGTAVRLSEKTNVEVAATISEVAFDAGAGSYDNYLRETLNRTTRKGALSVRHQLTPLTTMTMAVGMTDERFLFSPARNSRSIRVAPEFEFAPSALISGKAFVGYLAFDAQDASVPDFKGAVASVELAYMLSGSTRLMFQANRDLEYSYEAIAPYYVISGLGGGIIQQITDTVGVTARGAHYLLDYRSMASSSPDNGSVSADTMIVEGAGVIYKIGHNLQVTINADYYHRMSPRLLRDYTGFRGGSSVVYGF